MCYIWDVKYEGGEPIFDPRDNDIDIRDMPQWLKAVQSGDCEPGDYTSAVNRMNGWNHMCRSHKESSTAMYRYMRP